jgi:hypothetical protein
MLRIGTLILGIIFYTQSWVPILFCQKDSTGFILSTQTSDALEDQVASFGDDETNADFNTQFEHLEGYLKEPISINDASAEILSQPGLMNEQQAVNLVAYRKELGALLALEELQSVPGMNLPTIRRILPFITLGNSNEGKFSYKDFFRDRASAFFVRWGQTVERSNGYKRDEDGGDPNFLGDPSRIYMRYRYRYKNIVSYGFTLDKDGGEPWRNPKNPIGFDFMSGHVFFNPNLSLWKPKNKYSSPWKIKRIAIGDYNLGLGQGVIMSPGFAQGKSIFTTQIKRNSGVLTGYSGANEAIFLRGAAIEVGNDKWKSILFVSNKNRDANIVALNDSVNFDLAETGFSSILISGLHRTNTEIENKNSISEFLVGGMFGRKENNWHINIQGVQGQTNPPRVPDENPYRAFLLTGSLTQNASIDYSFRWRNLFAFGESALDQDGKKALLNGLLFTPDRRISLAFLHRDFDPGFAALYPRPFSESIQSQNERGFYAGVEIYPSQRWKISGYYDRWTRPWLTFLTDRPTQGFEYVARTTYTIKRKLEAYIQIRSTQRENSLSEEFLKTSSLQFGSRASVRLHCNATLFKGLELRQRAEYSLANNSRGFLIYQDVLVSPLNSSWVFTGRMAYFNTDDFASRIYAFENDLLYSFSIPAYFGKGTRWYANIRYKGFKDITLEARMARFSFANQKSIGTANDEIDGSTRTDWRLQVKYSF